MNRLLNSDLQQHTYFPSICTVKVESLGFDDITCVWFLTLCFGIHYSVQEKLDKYQKAKMLENLRHLENPMIFELCGTLFADDKRSVWNGPHSLVQQKASTRKSAIRAAVSKLLQ